jgi:hypothetical protein
VQLALSKAKNDGAQNAARKVDNYIPGENKKGYSGFDFEQHF